MEFSSPHLVLCIQVVVAVAVAEAENENENDNDSDSDSDSDSNSNSNSDDLLGHWFKSSTSQKVSQACIVRLYDRFQTLDKEQKGFLSKYDLQRIGALAVNPLGDRIINAFFKDGEELTDFRAFIRVLAHFRPVEEGRSKEAGYPEPMNSRLSKLKFAFQLYDQDHDGKISRAEMLQVLQLMVGIQVTEEQLACIVERTIQEADRDGDGAISFEEFAMSVEKLNIEQKMSLRMLK